MPETRNMNHVDWNRVNSILVECATALMGAFGMAVVHDPAEQPFEALQDGILAVIGFGGDQVRGSLLISASRGLLSSSCPVSRSPEHIELEILQDWGGELANQLL